MGNDIVLVDFLGILVRPMSDVRPVFEKVAEANPDIVFAKVDTEAEPGLAGYFQISSIPTLMAIRNGVVLYSQQGTPATGAGEPGASGAGRRHGRRQEETRRGLRQRPFLGPRHGRQGAEQRR